MKKLLPARRSINCIAAAASSGGNASRRRNAVTNCAQMKNGNRMNDRPGTRSCRMVTIELMAPNNDDVTRKSIPTSHIVWPVVGEMTDRGGYEVHPLLAAPPGRKKLASMIVPPAA